MNPTAKSTLSPLDLLLIELTSTAYVRGTVEAAMYAYTGENKEQTMEQGRLYVEKQAAKEKELMQKIRALVGG